MALPVISACGHETIILPSAILSSHTYRFKGWTFRDLTDDIPAILDHWKSEGIKFDACYTGYLGSKRQIDIIKGIFADMLVAGGLKIVDPAMADEGLLYPGFNDEYVEEMKKLVAVSDIVLPNITEAAYGDRIQRKIRRNVRQRTRRKIKAFGREGGRYYGREIRRRFYRSVRKRRKR